MRVSGNSHKDAAQMSKCPSLVCDEWIAPPSASPHNSADVNLLVIHASVILSHSEAPHCSQSAITSAILCRRTIHCSSVSVRIAVSFLCRIFSPFQSQPRLSDFGLFGG